ncbi:methylthioribulose 1-phosphate dehydratase [Jeotgalibacillus proteolyticus]|uniref:Methylthioribulose-1-phosphate dehydratase n=1 Tax=Jeotgalibacillus proteolyticus TaxID=2082395 RepID=A0A2S5GA19_9BACL|nr:methylthioribulose 1-phosphate dehydratase [Jeotgalibacillus proteolyticus]PPA69867.1 methylthioribulose 1-phosphate dehydratase [Jeotgalibacillus proteolyticus]
MTSLSTLYTERWQELAEIKDELAERDWFPGTSGNLSIKVRDEPLQFLVTASGKDKRKRTPEDFILVDENSLPVHGGTLRPSAETVLHQKIYQKTNAGCSLHVHTVANNVISELYGDEGRITFKGLELIKAFNIWEEDGEITIPIIDNLSDLPALAELLAEQITDQTYGVLIRNHGITVWGQNGFEAKKHLEAFEFLFNYQLTLSSFKKF